jgi:hypothetical protein
MAVSNGQLANSTTFNGAFLSRTIDTSTVGTVTLNNTSNVNSGAQIVNLQRAVNEIFNAVGMAGEGDAARNDYASNLVVPDGSSRRTAIELLDANFHISTGHNHNGINSKSISALTLSDINQFRAEWIGQNLSIVSQIEDFNFLALTGTDFDVVGAGLNINLGDSAGYLWYNVTDGLTQTDPTGVGTSVQVNILLADTAASIATKSKTALDAAALTEVLSTSAALSIFEVIYQTGTIASGDEGTAPVGFAVIQFGSSLGSISGTSVDVSSVFGAKTAGGNEAGAGVATNLPNNKVEIRNFESQTFVEDAEGQKVYGRLTELTGVWTLSFYTLEAGVETVHSLSSQNLSIFYREVFSLADIPTFGVDAGILGTLDLTADVVVATEAISGKVLLSNVVATSVGSANVKGTSARVSHEDHVHQGLHAVQEFTEAVNVFGDIILKGTGATSVTRSGQTFTINSATATHDKAEFSLLSGDISNGYVDLTQVALNDSIDFVVSGLISREGVDYTVNYTGGVSSKTRITFSAHTPTLAIGDVVIIKYQY